MSFLVMLIGVFLQIKWAESKVSSSIAERTMGLVWIFWRQSSDQPCNEVDLPQLRGWLG